MFFKSDCYNFFYNSLKLTFLEKLKIYNINIDENSKFNRVTILILNTIFCKCNMCFITYVRTNQIYIYI